MAADWPSFGTMVTNLREFPAPADNDVAGQIEAFIAAWQRQQQKAEAIAESHQGIGQGIFQRKIALLSVSQRLSAHTLPLASAPAAVSPRSRAAGASPAFTSETCSEDPVISP